MNEPNEFEKGRSTAMWFGGTVYVGVVLAATTLFVSFILTAFPEDAYFSRLVMIVAGLLIGGSMLAFPVALHNWAVSGIHRQVTTGLYYGEMVIIAVNTIVSFGSLLAKYTGFILPDWVRLYEPFSVVSIVYTLAAWGTVFHLDPQAKAKASERSADQKFFEKISQKRLEFVDSIEGEEAVIQIALADIRERYNPERYQKSKQHFGRARLSQTPKTPQAWPGMSQVPADEREAVTVPFGNNGREAG